MAPHRGKFPPRFKAEAVQFVIETGRPLAKIARELEINEGTLATGRTNGSRAIPSLRRP